MSMNQSDNDLNALGKSQLNPGIITPSDGTRTPGEPIKMSGSSSNNNYENIPNRQAG